MIFQGKFAEQENWSAKRDKSRYLVHGVYFVACRVLKLVRYPNDFHFVTNGGTVRFPIDMYVAFERELSVISPEQRLPETVP